MTSNSDETIQLYNAKEGRHDKTLLSKKYGAKLAKFTHTSSSIIYASTKANGWLTPFTVITVREEEKARWDGS